MKHMMRLIVLALAAILFFSCASWRPRPTPGASPSAQPPAGLTPEQAPQFVVFGSDDNGYSGLEGSGAGGGLHFLTGLFAGLRNPPGSGDPRTFDAARPHYSFYVNTYYILPAGAKGSAYAPAAEGREDPSFVKRAWKEAVDEGHEIGVHTHSHPHGGQYSRGQWKKEIRLCISILGRPFQGAGARAGLGIPRSRLFGFRTPYLEYNDNVLREVQRSRFLYDCSLEEGTQPDQNGGDFLWPYRLDWGSPANTPLIGRHPGLWEIPVYVFVVPPDDECARYGVAPGLRAELRKRQDYFDPAAGKITGMDWNLWCEFAMSPAEFLATLKYTLDRRLQGNRCPLTIGLHSELYSDRSDTTGLNATVAERRSALSEFISYLLQVPAVRLVSHKELLDWLQRPAPLADARGTAAKDK